MKTSWLRAVPVLLLNVCIFWPLYIAMVGVLWAVGLLLIWWAARKPRVTYMPSRVWSDRVIWNWTLTWMKPLWGNEQDGVTGLPVNYPSSLAGWSDRQFSGWAARIFQWSALRNSTNNLRFMHYFVPWLGWLNPKTIEPARIRWSGIAVPMDAVLLVRHVYTPGIEGEAHDTGDVAYERRFALQLVRQGLYAGLKIAVRIRGRAHQIWFGWKLNTGMAVPGWWPEDPCWKGVGFTCGQVRHS